MATIKLTVQSDFDQASADLKAFGNITEKEAKRIEKFVSGFKTEQIDRFTERNARAAAAVTATSGKLAGMQTEYKGLQREIQRLIKAGMDPQDDKLKTLRDRYNQLEKEIKDVTTAQAGQEKSSKFAIKSFTDLAVAGKVAITAFKQVYSAARNLEDAYFAQQESVLLLESALRASGQEVDNNSRQMQQFASSLQAVTTVGDETSIQLMQIATSAGLSAEQAQQATKDAIGLSKAFGVDLQAAIKATTNAQQGNYDLLNRYIPSVKNATDETQKAAIAEDALAKAFEVATAQGNTARGEQQQLNNLWGDTKEILGDLISQGFTPLRRAASNFLTDFNQMITQSREFKAAMDAYKQGGTIPEKMGIDDLNTQIDVARQKIANLRQEASLDTMTGGAQLQPQIDALEDYVAALEKERSTKAELARWSGVQASAEQALAKTEAEAAAAAAAAAAERAKDLAALESAYASTKEGQIAALEAQIAYFESFRQVGRVLPVLEELRAKLAAIKGETSDAESETQKRIDALQEEARINAELRQAEIDLDALVAEKKKEQTEKEKKDLEELIALRFQYASAALGAFQAIDQFASAVSAAELQRMEEQGATEEELAAKKKQIARDEAKRQKALGLFQVGVDTASAIVGFLANPGGIAGIALSVAAGVTGAIQAAAIAATPLPTAQTGTMSPITIPDTGRGNDSVAVMAAPGEQVSVTPRGENGMAQVINVYLERAVLFSYINQGIRSGEIRITAKNIQGGAG